MIARVIREYVESEAIEPFVLANDVSSVRLHFPIAHEHW